MSGIRAKFVNADGGWQYRWIPRMMPEYQFAIMPRVQWGAAMSDGTTTMVTVRRRRFEYNGQNENRMPVYMEVVE